VLTSQKDYASLEMSTTVTAPSGTGAAESAPEVSRSLVQEIEAFKADCENRYRFNSRWDNMLNVAGVLLSVGIIAAGTWKQSEIATVLGGLVGSIVTAQRAFPFGQRAQFYRAVIGQTSNLLTEIRAGLLPMSEAVSTLKTLRLDYAQQLPRGSSFRIGGSSDSGSAITTP
jgi:hypothetical protein